MYDVSCFRKQAGLKALGPARPLVSRSVSLWIRVLWSLQHNVVLCWLVSYFQVSL